MISSFLTNTSTEGLKPLGTAPQRSFELVSDTIRTRFSDRHAALFAEPVATQYGDRFDWYATVEGSARPLAEILDGAAIRADLDEMVGDIKGYADELLGSKLADDQRLGEALANALEIPDEAAIFVITPQNGVDPQPVLINWAWMRDEQIAVRGVLTGKDKRQPKRHVGAVAAAPVVATGISALWWWLVWLGWLLLALIIAAIIYLMVEPCGLRLSWFPNDCEKVEVVPDTLAEERGLLEDQIALVQKEIHIKDRLCQPDFDQLPIYDPDQPPPGIQPSLPINPEVDDRAEAAGAARGDLSFTLIWEGSDDLDLHTTCPTGETLFFLDKARCNGIMDLDMNGFQVVPNPVENTYFTDPLDGAYRVRVNLYRLRGQEPRSFTLQVREGDRVTTQKGTVSLENRDWQYTYQYRKK